MLFNSYIFILLFLPVALIGYFALNKYAYGKKGMPGIIWLFLMSLWFYGYQKPVYLILILVSIAINYTIGRILLRYKREKTDNRKKQKGIVWLGILFNLGILFYFKYWNFFLITIDDIWGEDWTVHIALPLGISFFTFQQISYIVDCYKEEKGLDYHFFEYAAYVAFFPQLVAGPIVMHSELVPQLQDKEKKVLNYTNMSIGLYAFSLGLAKKVLIADSLAKIVNVGFQGLRNLNTGTALISMLAYTLQLYFDFSGYCDMALGMAKMFNVELPYNFNSPYKAKSISEFWDRWHMTLTRFFTHYVYIPLGGSRRGKLRTYWNTLLVFFLSGVWHGANWTFMVWGLMHGVLMTLEKIGKDCGIKGKELPRFLQKTGNVVKTVWTFALVNLMWIYFRMADLEDANLVIRKMFSGGFEIKPELLAVVNDMIEFRLVGRLGLNGVFDRYPWLPCAILLSVFTYAVFFMKNTQEKLQTKEYNWVRSVITIGLIVWSVLSLSDVSEFLYFNF